MDVRMACFCLGTNTFAKASLDGCLVRNGNAEMENNVRIVWLIDFPARDSVVYCEDFR